MTDYLRIADAAILHGAVQKSCELRDFLATVDSLDPLDVIVEIGTESGGTLYAWRQLADTVFGIDKSPPGTIYGHNGAARNEHGAQVIIGDSHDAETLMALEEHLQGRPIDCLFIDGDHSYGGVRQDYEMYAPLVRPGGVIGFHDIVAHALGGCHVDEFWAELKMSNDSVVEIISPEGGPWGLGQIGPWGGIGAIKKGSKVTYPYAPSGLTGSPFFAATELANRLQIDPATINSGLANLLAQLASDAVREEIRQQIDFVANDSITIFGDNGEVLMLPQRPVTAVSSVVLAGQALTPVQVNSTSTMLMYDFRPEGALRRVVYGGSFFAGQLYFKWPLGVPVSITYSHGYTTPPSAIKRVALELAAGAYVNPELYDKGRVGLVEWESQNIALNFTEAQRRSLDIYRNVSLTI